MDIGELAAHDFEQIQILRDDTAGMLAFIAVHDTRLGPAFGGIRRWRYRHPGAALADALRLAEAMTLKCAAAGVPGGGAKVVLIDAPSLDRCAAYRRIGDFVEQMNGRFFTGPDVGTETSDLEEVAQRTGYVARPDEIGNLAEPTALGVFSGLQAVGDRLGFDGVRGLHVLVQGLGAVGHRLAQLLTAGSARVTVCDLDRDRVERVRAELEVEVVEPGLLLSVEADVWAPCALGGVVHDLSLEHLKVRAVAGSANNVLASPAHGAALFQRGVLYAPDFVINAGALIHGAWSHIEGAPPERARIEAIGERIGSILDTSITEGAAPEVVAQRLARDELDKLPRAPYFPVRSGQAED
jgi:leucine dehydrogenase